jgi:DNA-binding MarR family transcriptional regulator
MLMEVEEKLQYIKSVDPEGSERLRRLLDRRSFLLDRNVYGERFTERQFNLVFDPLLTSAYEKARILEQLGMHDSTVAALSDALSLDKARVFDHLKDLLKKNMVGIEAFQERHPVFRKR